MYVYDTHMTEVVDRALLRTRRLWSRPDRRVAPGVDLSTVLVCEALAEGASSVADVATSLDVAPSTASRLVARAASAGALGAGSCPTDHRRVRLALTARGHRLVEEGRAFRAARLERLMAGWTADEVGTFGRLLTRLADALARDDTAFPAPPPTPATTAGPHARRRSP
jgi:DNA-binding MarR family transcriptional regulator